MITFSLLKSVNWWHGEKVLVAGEQNKEMNSSVTVPAGWVAKYTRCSSRESLVFCTFP